MKRLSAVLTVVALLAGCTPRIAVVDAASGLPIQATVRELDGGRLLVEANGYESWSGPARPQVALHPLWLARFAGEQTMRRREVPPPCPGCPGKAK